MEKQSPSIAIKVLSVIVVLLLLAFSAFIYLERNASNKLLDMLLLARPGIKLTDIKEQLGSPMQEAHELKDVMEWGPIKDEKFCQGKVLYSFYAVTPTCRAIDVYTDTNGVIIYSTWHGL